MLPCILPSCEHINVVTKKNLFPTLLYSRIKVKCHLRKVLLVERALKHFALIVMLSLQDGTSAPATLRAFTVDEV